MQQLPKDPYVILLYSSYLIEVLNSYQSGYTLLQVRGSAWVACWVYFTACLYCACGCTA